MDVIYRPFVAKYQSGSHDWGAPLRRLEGDRFH